MNRATQLCCSIIEGIQSNESIDVLINLYSQLGRELGSFGHGDGHGHGHGDGNGNGNDPQSDKRITSIDTTCSECENCIHKITFDDDTVEYWPLDKILSKTKLSPYNPKFLEIMYVCGRRGEFPDKKIKKVGTFIQDSLPPTSMVFFIDGSKQVLSGPQIYYLFKKYGIDDPDSCDMVEREFGPCIR